MNVMPTQRVLASLLLLGVLAGCQPKTAEPEHVARLPDFAGLVDSVGPTVVNISAESLVLPDAESADGDIGEPEQPLGPDWSPENSEDPLAPSLAPEGVPEAGAEPEALPEEAMGSGFVLWADGYVITNAHVVSNTQKLVVRFSDRRELPATVVGIDSFSDIALLKVDAKDLPTVKIADVSKIKVGQWVLAIGSPFGFDYSVTSGIVSAKGRNLFTEQYVPFIQTDAAINPGNSGGPLFNLAGEVIGVNSQIYSQTGGNSGIAFAVPIDVAVKVAEQLKAHGRVKRGWLGVVVQELTREMLQTFNLDKPQGALVAKVVPSSPAESAGLLAGDVILSFNQVALANSRQLPPLVGSADPGSNVPLSVLREGKKITVTVKMQELPEQDIAESAVVPLPLGLGLAALSDDERKGGKVSEGGALVTELRPGPAKDAGLREGDILISIGGQQIDSPSRLSEVASRLTPGSSVPLLIQRNGSPLFLALEIPEVKVR